MSVTTRRFSGKGSLLSSSASRTVKYELTVLAENSLELGRGEILGRFQNFLPLVQAQTNGETLCLQMEDGRMLPVEVEFNLGSAHSFQALDGPRTA